MARDSYSVSEAARHLGISVETLRRWGRVGQITAHRDGGNRRIIPASEIDRIRGMSDAGSPSARNRIRAVVTEVRTDGLMAQIEMVVSDPARLVAVITRDAMDDLGLRPGMAATAIVKSTSIIVQH